MENELIIVREICMVIASIAALGFVVLLFVNRKKYSNVTDALRRNDRSHFLAEFLVVGLNIAEIFSRIRKSSEDQKFAGNLKLRKVLSDNYGKRYADYYYMVTRAKQYTLGLAGIVAIFMVAAISMDPIRIVYSAIFSAGCVYLCIYTEERKSDQKKEELLAEFPVVLSKLTLLICSGMTVRDAWKKTAEGGEGAFYMEMKETLADIENGIMETEAYKDFADRCEVKEIQKFISMLIQNMKKGSKELTIYLRDMSTEMWKLRKDNAMIKGSKNATLMIIPTSLLFIGILIMIIAPAFCQLSL